MVYSCFLRQKIQVKPLLHDNMLNLPSAFVTLSDFVQ